MNSHSLFDGELVRLSVFEERDAEVESKWTHDAEYWRGSEDEFLRPLSPFHIKKKYDQFQKQSGEFKTSYHFAVRTRAEERLVGFARLSGIEWNSGVARVSLGIGLPEDRGRGYGTEALRLILRYAFGELNLYRVTLGVFEYNPRAIRSYEKAGFVLEGRTRQDVYRDGTRSDSLWMGILRKEWEEQKAREGG